MGVSLERVQYKFASIIGELCSEPVVLSQFAVWLDLRLAEYKSKGTISLDCSGSRPEPSWMKGVMPQSVPAASHQQHLASALPYRGIGLTRERTVTQRNMGSPGSSSSRLQSAAHLNSYTNVLDGSLAEEGDIMCTSSNNISIGEDRLSADVVVVKNELIDSEVFPISLHDNVNTDTADRLQRKRAGGSPFSSHHGDIAKRKKQTASSTTSTSPSQNSTTNQSLMSVIGGENIDSHFTQGSRDEHGEESPSKGENSSSFAHSLVTTSPYRYNRNSSTAMENLNFGTRETTQGISTPTSEDDSNNDAWRDRKTADGSFCTASPTQFSTLDNKLLLLPDQKCSICGYFSTKPYNIRRHMLKHRPDMKFKCPYCFHGFIDKYQLTHHMKKKHREEMLSFDTSLEEDGSFVKTVIPVSSLSGISLGKPPLSEMYV